MEDGYNIITNDEHIIDILKKQYPEDFKSIKLLEVSKALVKLKIIEASLINTDYDEVNSPNGLEFLLESCKIALDNTN